MSDCEDTDDSCVEEAPAEWEIRKEWLETILTDHHKERVKVTQFTVDPECTLSESVLSVISGVKGEYRLVESNECYDLSIIVKQLPHDPLCRYFVTEGKFDLREIKFYTQVIPELKDFQRRHLIAEKAVSPSCVSLKVPLCYHAHYTPAGGTGDSPVPPESILVLQDLNDIGFKTTKFSDGLRLDQTKIALEAIARIHAHSLAMKVIDGVDIAERYPFLFQTAKATDSYQQLVERGLPQLDHFLESRSGFEEVLNALLVLRPRINDIISALLAPKGPLALITHTDFWCNNMLFRDGLDGPECCILDWQMVTYSRPTNDIALLLVSSVQSELRRKHTESLLDAYWRALTGTSECLGLDIPQDLGYTRDDLDKDYRKSLLLALLLCIGSVDIALGDPLTEQRLVDVLEDLHKDGVLMDEAIIATSESES